MSAIGTIHTGMAEVAVASDSKLFKNALIISEVRFLGDSLVALLQRETSLGVCAHAATWEQALAAQASQPAVVLLDVAFPGGAKTVVQLRCVMPQSSIIAFGIRETEEHVLRWAEAGIAGYVPNTASVEDLISLVKQISRGEQSCASHIAGILLRRIASAARRAPLLPDSSAALTRRESEIMHLVIAGYSNKDIARQLRISLGTTKSHVHNLLGKLSLRRRADVMARMRGGWHEGIGPDGS